MALALGIPMGIYTALKRHGVLSKAFMAISLAGISLPTFPIGILLILFFGVQLRWLPSFGRGDVVGLGWWTTGFLTVRPAGADHARHHAGAVPDDADHAAGARRDAGSAARRLHRQRAPRPAGAADQFPPCAQEHHGAGHHHHRPAAGSIIAFAIITETVFQWPGMGLLFIQAISTVDIPVMAAYLVLIAFMFVVINLIVDLLYFAVDPRLRVQSK